MENTNTYNIKIVSTIDELDDNGLIESTEKNEESYEATLPSGAQLSQFPTTRVARTRRLTPLSQSRAMRLL